ncbi:hypothetical protein B4119_0591 [Parageobacillus caldoxylosilyticus]|uniref:Uncharacterized protein n=1 Tax=Saccharococcus caldoxylosilyticus TaxID=81408 RepID=A0A150L489_9BACL|nr:hypothetical protein B4119_0591 [Parageobacillus caldoxylosilyticus]
MDNLHKKEPSFLARCQTAKTIGKRYQFHLKILLLVRKNRASTFLVVRRPNNVCFFFLVKK